MNIERIIENIRKRLYVRMDADDETEEQPKRKRGGNTRLPYGLCKSEGIGTEGLTPKEAWEAYFKKTGVSPNEAYKDHFGKKGEENKGEVKKEESKKSKKGKDPFKKITEENVEAAYDEETRILTEIYNEHGADVFALASRGMLKKLGINGKEEKELVSKMNRMEDIKKRRYKYLGIKSSTTKYYTGADLDRDSLNSCESFAQAKHYMEDKYGVLFDCVDFDDTKGNKLNLDMAKKIMAGAEACYKEYPFLNGRVDVIDTLYKGVMSYGFAGDRYHKVGVDTEKLKNIDSILKDCDERKQWHKNASVESLVAHEYAHAIEHWIGEKYGKKFEKSDYEIEESMKNSSFAASIVQSAYYSLKTPKSITDCQRGISKYAMATYGETLAEAFADCYANGDDANDFSKAIKRKTLERVREYMNN